MTTSLETILEEPSGPIVWLDYWEYTRRLLRDGDSLPWFDAAELDSFVRKSDGLVGGSVLPIPCIDVFEDFLAAAPSLKEEMSSKRRITYPLKAFLREPGLRQLLAKSLDVIRSGVPGKPLVLCVPTPRVLVGWAYASAHGELPDDVSVDHADAAAVYLSEFLDALSSSPIGGLLLEESKGLPFDPRFDHASVNQPVLNVARHLRWAVGIRFDGDDQPTRGAERFDFVVGVDSSSSSPSREARSVPDTYFRDPSDHKPEGNFYFATIPGDALPELVLQRCAELRAA